MTGLTTPLQPQHNTAMGESPVAVSVASVSERQNAFAPRLPRNAISRKLPEEIQYRISEILHAAKSYVAVREDAEVMEACARQGVTLHDATLKAWMNTAEHQAYMDAHSKFSKDMARRKMTAAFITAEGGSDDLARVGHFKLLNLILQKIDDGECIETKELKLLGDAIAQFSKISQVDKVAEAREIFAQKESAYQAQIAELSARIISITNETKSNIDMSTIADKMNEVLGVKS